MSPTSSSASMLSSVETSFGSSTTLGTATIGHSGHEVNTFAEMTKGMLQYKAHITSTSDHSITVTQSMHTTNQLELYSNTIM
jgi:hypothetical protein